MRRFLRVAAGSRWSTVFVLLAVAALAGTFVGRDTTTARPEEPVSYDHPAQPAVEIGRPQVRNISRVVGQPGTVEAYERTPIYSKLPAYIEKWNVDIGDRVKKGDILARLFVPELVDDWETKKAAVELSGERVELAKRDVEIARADAMAAAAHLQEVKDNLDQYDALVARWELQVSRIKREVTRGDVDPQTLTETENQLRASRAVREGAKAAIARVEAELRSKRAAESRTDVAVRVANAELKVARSEAKRLEALVGYLTLSAPYDGVVTTRNANTGDFVFPAAGDLPGALAPPRTSPAAPMPVYVIQRTDVVRVCVDVPEADARFTQQGTDVSVQIKQARDQWIAARVARTSWALNPKTRTLRAEVDLDNAAGRLQAGMYAYGKIAVRSENVQALPRAAVFEGGDKTFCWMYENGRAVQTEIRTGVSDGTWIEVISRRLPGRADGLESWTPIDGSEQIILGDRSHLTGGGPVQKK